MVTFHSRVPRPVGPTMSFRSGRVDFNPFMVEFGSVTIRLLIFRPGTTAAERARVGVYSSLVARGLWMPVVIFAMLLTPEPIRSWGFWWCIGFGAVVTAAIVAATWLLARPTLTGARGIRITARASKHGPLISGDMGLLEEYVSRLGSLESAGLDPVEYEAWWARIYDDITWSRGES